MAEGARRTRPPGVAVDPAQVRRAREEAGLSLAAVAGQELTRGAIHRIEQGKVRPSMRTLKLIAERTGQPVHRFLRSELDGPLGSRRIVEFELILARLERMIGRGELSEALATIDERLVGTPGKHEEAQLRYLAGRCYLAKSEPLAALSHFRKALTIFEEVGDDRKAIDCLAGEASALGMEEDPSALDHGHEALRRCHRLDPVPREAEVLILNIVAGIHLMRHDWPRAIATYNSVIEASGHIKDLERLAQTFDGLSLAYQGMGDLNSAVRYSYKALGLTAMRRNLLSLARAENNVGVLLIRMGRHGEAEEHLRRSLQYCEEGNITTGRCHVLLSLGQLRLDLGDRAGAESAMLEAERLAEAGSERLSLALTKQWLGKLYASAGEHRKADRYFLAAIMLLNQLNATHRLAECHADYARIMDERGDLEGALEHWRAASELYRPDVGRMGMEDEFVHWGDLELRAT